METMADRVIKENSPDGLVFIVADATNGEILSLVSRPDYDPNEYRISTPEQRRNRTVSYVYEPGSVFKVFTLAGIMSLGGINNNTVFHTSGGYKSSRFRDPITDMSDYGTIGAEGIIMKSSNVGAALASDTVDDKTFHALLSSFGFGEKTGIELQGEEKGILKDTPTWSARTKPTMAFGQEVGVSAIQMVQAATVFANEGAMIKPHLVKAVMSPGGQILREGTRQVIRQVINSASSSYMLSYMNAATEGGTARRSKVEGINISVKTGTSQMIDTKTHGYSKDAYIASSLALFPTEKPRIIMYVAIFRPRGSSVYGGMIAAPLIKEGASFLIPHLGIERVGDIVQVQSPQVKISIPRLPTLSDRVPNFRGLPLRTLMPLLSQKRYGVKIEGSGWVVDQVPPHGTPLEDGMKIRLILSERPTSGE
jgi:cell division protein FtsI (penicillin-binding protein 3)